MNEELKPCPFCGGIAKIKESLSDCKWLSATMRRNAVGIGCVNCCAMFLFRPYSRTLSREKAKENAVKAWNRRTNDE